MSSRQSENGGETARVPLTYVFDAYCGWCYGFTQAFEAFVTQHRDSIDLRVVAGGLFTGSGVSPIGSMPYIDAANERIAELTGVRFGDPYQRLIADGSFEMDSTDAARAFVALRLQDPARSVEISGSLLRAFYLRGRSLSDARTVRDVATELELDGAAALEAFESPWAHTAASEEFEHARELGVNGFPSVLVHLPTGRLARLGDAVSTAQQLSEEFNSLRSLAA